MYVGTCKSEGDMDRPSCHLEVSSTSSFLPGPSQRTSQFESWMLSPVRGLVALPTPPLSYTPGPPGQRERERERESFESVTFKPILFQCYTSLDHTRYVYCTCSAVSVSTAQVAGGGGGSQLTFYSSTHDKVVASCSKSPSNTPSAP